MSQAAPPATASTPGRDLLPDSTGLFTTAHFIWIVLFAAVIVLAIWWGARLKHRRKSADRAIEQHNEQLRDDAPAAESGAAEPPAAPAAFVPPSMPEPDVVPLGPAPHLADAGPADGPVTQLKGLGPKVADRLAELGVTTVGQVAALTDDQAEQLDAQLGPFRGRMARDRWLEQARFLAAGDRAGFEAVFGRL